MFKIGLLATVLAGFTACATDGRDGTNGTNGTNGMNGSNGANGSDGPQGPQGPAGPELALPGVYTLDNASTGNHVAAFTRATDGNLSRLGEFSTDSNGLGSAIGSQDAIVFDATSQRFFAVNTGASTISMMSIDEDGTLTTLAMVPSGGTRPVSIAAHAGVVYVANQGDITAQTVGANITGFKVDGDNLTPIASSTQALSGTTDVHPTDIKFSPDGSQLVVVERFAGKLDTFAVDASSGVAAAGNFQASAGQQPFALDFSPEGFALVAEVGNGTATGSSVSSYALSAAGALTPVTSALATEQGAACWIVAAGGYAYIANAATANLTGVVVDVDGTLSLQDPSGVTATSGPGAIDLAVSPDRGWLYSLASGPHVINIYAINADGTLTQHPALPNLPATAAGLVAR